MLGLKLIHVGKRGPQGRYVTIFYKLPWYEKIEIDTLFSIKALLTKTFISHISLEWVQSDVIKSIVMNMYTAYPNSL